MTILRLFCSIQITTCLIGNFAICQILSFSFLNRIFQGILSCTQHFITKPENATIRKGDTAVLKCKIGDQAQIGQTIWTKDGDMLGPSKIQITDTLDAEKINIKISDADYKLLAYPNMQIVGNHADGEYHLEIANVISENTLFSIDILFGLYNFKVTVDDDSEYECQVQPSIGGHDALRAAAFLNVIGRIDDSA